MCIRDRPSYKPGVTLTNLNDIMPSFVSETLKDGIKFFANRLHGLDVYKRQVEVDVYDGEAYSPLIPK